MRNNQYFISTEQQEIKDFEYHLFGKFHIYRDARLAYSFVEKNVISLAILGFIFDPLNPTKSYQEIAETLVQYNSKNALFEAIESYSGRYVILYANTKETILCHDMFGQRQINYRKNKEELYVSSSVKLMLETLQFQPEFIPEYEKLILDKGFQQFDQWFLGDLTWDKNIKKLLPNHYINLTHYSIQRMPFFEIPDKKESEVLAEIKTIVEGNYRAIFYHFENVYQSLTAGYDSRILLVLSKDFWNKIQFYTFKRKDANSQRDAKTAKQLSEIFKFKYKFIHKPIQNSSFEENYKSQFIVPRTSPKFYNILYFKSLKSKKSINITGDGVQMIRNLRMPESLESAEKLFDSLSFSHHPYHIESFKNWLNEAQKTSQANNVLISDLFTQEIAQGQLTARWALEFDLSDCEEFNPFNHKKMIYSILKNIEFKERLIPENIFPKKIMEAYLPESTKIPFNPLTWKGKVKKILNYFSNF